MLPVASSQISQKIEPTKNDETYRLYGEGDLARWHDTDWSYFHDYPCKGERTIEGKDDTLASYCSECGLVVKSAMGAVASVGGPRGGRGCHVPTGSLKPN